MGKPSILLKATNKPEIIVFDLPKAFPSSNLIFAGKIDWQIKISLS